MATFDLSAGNDAFPIFSGQNFDNDLIYGNAGADTLQGGNGADLIYGGEGDDSLFGDDFDTTDTKSGCS